MLSKQIFVRHFEFNDSGEENQDDDPDSDTANEDDPDDDDSAVSSLLGLLHRTPKEASWRLSFR